MATRSKDLGQFDLTSLLPEQWRQTVQDTVNVVNNPLTAIKSVSFWSAYTPEKTYTGAQLDSMYKDPTPNPYLKVLQPVVVLDTVVGKKTIAPYGMPDPGAWEHNIKQVAAAGLTALIAGTAGLLMLGIAMGQASRRSTQRG